MRRSLYRPVMVAAVMLILVASLGACDDDLGEGYRFSPGGRGVSSIDSVTGRETSLGFEQWREERPGCSCEQGRKLPEVKTAYPDVVFTVDGPDGATVDQRGVFTARKPGTYVVTATGPLGSATITVVVTGTEIPPSDGEPAEEPAEEPAADPLLGTWEFTMWWSGQKSSEEDGVSTDEWEWFEGRGASQLIIGTSGDTYTLDSAFQNPTIEVTGTSVRITNTIEGFSVVLEGTVSGDRISGTQSYTDAVAGAFSTAWVATRVK